MSNALLEVNSIPKKWSTRDIRTPEQLDQEFKGLIISKKKKGEEGAEEERKFLRKKFLNPAFEIKKSQARFRSSILTVDQGGKSFTFLLLAIYLEIGVSYSLVKGYLR